MGLYRPEPPWIVRPRRWIPTATAAVTGCVLALDASSPVAVQDSNNPTTVSVTPPAGSGIVVFVEADAGLGAADEAITVSDAGAVLTWTRAIQHNGAPGAVAEVWWAYAATAPGTITVRATDNKGAVAKRVYVRVFTGVDPSVIGATNSGAGTSVAYTSTRVNSWGWSCGIGSGTPTAGAGQTLDDSTAGTGPDGDSTWVLRQNATTAAVGTSVTMSVTASSLHHVAVEVMPCTGTVGTAEAGRVVGVGATTGVAKKIAVVAGACTAISAARGAATKVTACGGVTIATGSATATGKKVTAQAGGAAAAGVTTAGDKKMAVEAGRVVAIGVTTGGDQKRAVEAGAVAATAVATGVAARTAAVAVAGLGRGVATTTGAVTTKIVGEGGRVAAVATGTGVDKKIAPQAGVAAGVAVETAGDKKIAVEAGRSVGVAATRASEAKILAGLGRTVAVSASVGAAQKITGVAGRVVGVGVVTGRESSIPIAIEAGRAVGVATARVTAVKVVAIAGTCTLAAAGRATAVHRGVGAGIGSLVGTTRGAATHRAIGTGASVTIATSRGQTAKIVAAAGSGFLIPITTGEIEQPQPPELSLMTVLYDVSAAIRDCVRDALATTDAGVPGNMRVCIVPGMIAWDDCTCGQLALTVTQIYYSRTFPNQDNGASFNCQLPYVVADLTVGLLRCAPQPDADSGQLSPSCVELDSAARVWFEDADAVRRGVLCCLIDMKASRQIEGYALGAQSSTGPEGGCVGSEFHISIGLSNCFTCV